MGWVEWVATALGIAYVVLMIRRNILCWVAGNLGVALQALSFYTVRLYADMMLQGVYFALGCYGFWVWWKYPARSEDRAVATIEHSKMWGKLLVVWVLGSALWAAVLILWTDAALPEFDATLAVASLIATWLQAHRYLENWLLWIGIDAAYAVVYWERGLYLYTVLYGLFVVLAWRGWHQWRKLIHEPNVAAG